MSLKHMSLKGWLSFGLLILGSSAAWADDKSSDCENPYEHFVFSWPIDHSCGKHTRGGTTVGTPVVESELPHPGWLSLQESGLSDFDKDRRAILAMAGGYKVTFDFLEVVGFSDDFARDKPYHSWGTEYVYVVEDTPNFISLQHVMVMKFLQENGEESEPFVMKHWRQDWTYQAKEMLVYDQSNDWHKVKIPKSQRKGAWVQSVYQVDDSPRYASYGNWQHNPSFSSWISQTTARPLPRRESSVRTDYDVLEGFNRHTISRFGWTQEEENWKKVNSGENGEATYLSKEIGIARYRAITDYDFSLGDQYMSSAGRFWADVRAVWHELISNNKSVSLNARVDGLPLFVPLFGYAEKLVGSDSYDSASGKAFARDTIESYLAQ